MNAKVLIFCEGIWLAHTARPLAIAMALRNAGCHVEFAASGKFTQLVAKEGFKVHAVATMDPARALAAIRSARVEYNRPLVEAYVDDELTVLKRVAPDVVLNDFRLPAAVSCRLARVPLVNILNAYMTNYYAPRRRAPNDFPLTRIIGAAATTAVFRPIMSLALRLYARPFSAVAKSRGLEPFGNIFDVMASPDLNLICDLDEFAPLAGAPANMKYIGPIIWEPNVPAPSWLSEIDPGRPSVYFTMGSTGFGHYYRVLKNAFAHTRYQVLITTGGVTDPGELPDNFHVAELAPASAILEKSSLVVCHGGNGTIYQSLAAAVPVLGIPTFHDQDFNMQRVVDLGIGAVLYPQDLSATTLREAVDRLVHDAPTRAAVAAFSSKIRATDAVSAALRLISDHLASRS